MPWPPIERCISAPTQAYLGDILYDDNLEPIAMRSKQLLEKIALGNRPRGAPNGVPSFEQVLHDPRGNVPCGAGYEHFGGRVNGRHRSAPAVV